MRRLWAVALLEARAAAAGPLPWTVLALAMLVGLSLNVTTFTSPSPEEAPHVNSVHALAWMLGMCGFLLYAPCAALLAGWSRLRDDEAGVTDLLRATPLSRSEHLGGKFLGTLAVIAGILAVHLCALALFHRFAPLAADLGRGPFHLGSYLLPALLFVLPQVVIMVGCALALADRSGRPLAIFALPVAYFLVALLFLSWEPPGSGLRLEGLLTTLDPTGLRWLVRENFGVDRGVAFYNHRSLPVDTPLLAGRLLTTVAGLLAVGLTVLRGEPRRRTGSKVPSRPGPAPTASPAPPPPFTSGFRSPRFAGRVASTARAELREILGQPVLYLLTPLLILLLLDVFTSRASVLGSRLVPTAGNLAVTGHGILAVFLGLVVLFLTVESFARETGTGAAPLVYSTSVSTRALVLGKTVAVGVATGLVLACAAALVVALLLVHPRGRVDLAPVVLVWGGLLLPTLFCWSAWVGVCFALTGHRLAAYAAGAASMVATGWHLRSDGLSWQTDPTLLGVALRWSDMGAFQLDRGALILNRLAVVALAVLLLTLAVRRFPRVEADLILAKGGGRALAKLKRRWRGWALPLAAGAVFVGSWAALGHLVATGPGGASERERAAAYHRHHYLTWADRPHADVEHVELTVHLHPHRHTAEVRGSYRVRNNTPGRLAALPFTLPTGVAAVHWTLDGGPAPVEQDHGLAVLRPPRPLEPGAHRVVEFRYTSRFPAGTSRSGEAPEQFVLPAGTRLHTLRDSFLPRPGFDPGRGAPAGLEPPRREPGWWREELEAGDGARRPFTTRVTVSVPEGHSVTSVGRRVATRLGDGRVTEVWESRTPVRALTVTAGRWLSKRRGGAAVHFHPGHEANADAMLETLAAARRHYSRWFAPYPWPELRLVEYPDVDANAIGFPTNIAFSEGIGFLSEVDGPDGGLFLVVAHEAAHQWWGNLLTAAGGPGTAHLVEAMAHYSALLLADEVGGEAARMELARKMEASYLASRRPGREQALLDVTEVRTAAEWSVVYEKGAWVTWMLQEHLGRERFLACLGELIDTYRRGPDHPATQDLLALLRPEAPDPAAYDRFVEQWFESVVVPEIRVTDALVRTAGDAWEVSATLENVGSGDVDVEVALRSAEGGNPGVLAGSLRTVRLAPGRPARLDWRLAGRSEAVLVDPHLRLLQRGRGGGTPLSPVAAGPAAAPHPSTP